MKKNTIVFCLILAMLMLTSACSSTKVTSGSKKVPPGQMKKMTGSQSAKPYAPGQQKKKH